MALLSAAFNAATSVLQRRAAVEPAAAPGPGLAAARSRIVFLLSQPEWWAGAAALALSAVCQVIALDVGELSVVQPLLASELLFTLLIGALVFHRRPDAGTWSCFALLAAGLALFLAAAAPSGGGETADRERWLGVGTVLVAALGILLAVAKRTKGPLRAAALGTATSVCFAATAALIKEVTARFPQGAEGVLTTWQTYAAALAGLAAVLLLQWTLKAGTLAVSQPALTLGDALISVALGTLLFGEDIATGWRLLPEALGVCLMAVGVAGLTRSPAVARGERWDDVTT